MMMTTHGFASISVIGVAKNALCHRETAHLEEADVRFFSKSRPNIDKLKEKRDVDGLIKALDYQEGAPLRSSSGYVPEHVRASRRIRNRAAVTLGELHVAGKIDASRAKERLLQVSLCDEDDTVRMRATYSLERIEKSERLFPKH